MSEGSGQQGGQQQTSQASQGKQNEPQQQQTPPADGQQQPTTEQLAATVNDLRKAIKSWETKYARLEQSHMTDQEKAVAKARDEGKAEAKLEAGKELAAAEFRAAAAGKLADPAGAIEVLDLARFVGDDGRPDTKSIAAAVDKLAAASPPKTPPHIPAGPREPAPDTKDFIRAQLNSRGA